MASDNGTCLSYLASLLQPIDRIEAKHVANCLITEFGSLAAVFAANEHGLRRTIPNHPDVIEYLLLLRRASLHALKFEMARDTVMATAQSLRDYLFADLAHQSAEQFRVLYLDSWNALIRDDLMGMGTINEATAYPREIVKRALDLGASGLILVHNHPSGNPEPSRADISITRDIASACRYLRLSVLDHVIIARTGWSSMRAKGLL
jgi:DNA repair protein RadC